MDLTQVAKNCARDFAESHEGQMPSAEDMRTMLQQFTGVDVSVWEAQEYRNIALDIAWCEGGGFVHGPGVCHWR